MPTAFRQTRPQITVSCAACCHKWRALQIVATCIAIIVSRRHAGLINMAGPVVVFRSQPVLNADLILLSAAGQQRLSKGTSNKLARYLHFGGRW